MTSTIISIQWDEAIETVSVDLELLKRGGEITATSESWVGEPRHYHYNTDSKFTSDRKGGGTLTIFYRERKNSHLQGLGCRWGKSAFLLNKQMLEGQVQWNDANEQFDSRGTPVYGGITTWRRFRSASAALGERERETIERLAREQARFRKRLLMIDPRCAVTGESNATVLEAAHVRAVSRGGADVEKNGLMLRADLHRLFDEGLFSISNRGRISINSKLRSEYYRSLLSRHNTLSAQTFSRIKAALGSTKRRRRA